MGHNEEILSASFLPSNNGSNPRILLAASDESPKIIDAADFSVSKVLSGHSEVVVSTAVSAKWGLIATGSKDKTVRLWDMATGECVAHAIGHGGLITSLVFPNKTADCFVSGSADKCIKKWQLAPVTATDSQLKFTAAADLTTLAHEKDVNTLAFPPRSDKMVASGGQDKVIKLWSFPDMKVLGEMKGHRRGIWTVAFHPTDKILLSGSGDATLRLWNLNDFTALKAFEGHTGAILNARFMQNGMQIMSSGADGLLKLWQIRTTDCAQTLESHDAKIWALDSMDKQSEVDLEKMQTIFDADQQLDDEHKMDCDDQKAEQEEALPQQWMVSGGEKLVLWRDCTQELAVQKQKDDAELRVHQAELQALIHAKKYVQVLNLCLKLNRPAQMRDIFVKLGVDTVEKRILLREEVAYLKKSRKSVKEIKAAQGSYRENNAAETAVSPTATKGEEDQESSNGQESEEKEDEAKRGDDGSDIKEEEEEFSTDDDIVDAVVVANPPWMQKQDEKTDEFDLHSWLKGLKMKEIKVLVEIIAKWNTNSRMTSLANLLLRNLLLIHNFDEMSKAIEGFNQMAKSIVGYSERHQSRWSQLMEKTYIIDMLLQSSGLQMASSVSTWKSEDITQKILFGNEQTEEKRNDDATKKLKRSNVVSDKEMKLPDLTGHLGNKSKRVKTK